MCDLFDSFMVVVKLVTTINFNNTTFEIYPSHILYYKANGTKTLNFAQNCRICPMFKFRSIFALNLHLLCRFCQVAGFPLINRLPTCLGGRYLAFII